MGRTNRTDKPDQTQNASPGLPVEPQSVLQSTRASSFAEAEPVDWNQRERRLCDTGPSARFGSQAVTLPRSPSENSPATPALMPTSWRSSTLANR